MKYQARTDFDIAPLPDPLPVTGPAGSIMSDPDFHSVICRVTDENTRNGASWTMGSSGNSRLWSFDSQRLAAATVGGSWQLFSFDRATMRPQASLFRFFGPVHFSGKGDAAYYLPGAAVMKVDFASMTISEFCDFAQALPAGFQVQWHGSFRMSADEKSCTMAFSEGAQESGHLVVSYRQGKGFRTLDTLSGEVGGDWGKQGKVNVALGWHIHEASQLKDGNLATFGQSGQDTDEMSLRYVWEIDSLELVPLQMGGHRAMGRRGVYALGPDWQLRYEGLTAGKGPQVVFPGKLANGVNHDAHYSWGADNDKAPFVMSGCAVGEKAQSPYPCAGWNEILVVDPVSGKVYRECHTFSTGQSEYFACANAIANQSPKGDFVAFTSDWGGTLGVDKQGKPRSDVFVVRVR